MALPAEEFDISPEKEARQISFLCHQLLVDPPSVSPQEVDLNGKTVVVTGSSAGLGLECCRQLLGLNLTKLILAVRDETKGTAARDTLSSATRRHLDARIERARALERLDIAVLNAAVFKTKFELNPSTRHEEVIQVNYLSTVLLAALLLPVFKDKHSHEDPGRILLVSSEVAAWAKYKERKGAPLLMALNKPETFDAAERYYTSKLLVQLFLRQLVQRVPPSVAVIAACNPGLCYESDLHRETWGTAVGHVFGGGGWLKRMIGRPMLVGARTLTDGAVKHGQEIHGHYLGDCKMKPMAPLVYQAEGIQIDEALWQETMTELSFAGVEDIIQGLGE